MAGIHNPWVARFAVVISAAIVHGSGRVDHRQAVQISALPVRRRRYAADSENVRAAATAECGIEAVVPWMEKLWMITYPPLPDQGGSDKLYRSFALAARSSRASAAYRRMIHRESSQLIIGPYFDAKGNVRADVTKLVGRMTAVMRHLTDPANKAYFFDMEGAIYSQSTHRKQGCSQARARLAGRAAFPVA